MVKNQLGCNRRRSADEATSMERLGTIAAVAAASKNDNRHREDHHSIRPDSSDLKRKRGHPSKAQGEGAPLPATFMSTVQDPGYEVEKIESSFRESHYSSGGGSGGGSFLSSSRAPQPTNNNIPGVPRPIPGPGPVPADSMTHKQELIKKLQAYGGNSSDDDFEDDDGDVSGEDVFSDDECDATNIGEAMTQYEQFLRNSYQMGLSDAKSRAVNGGFSQSALVNSGRAPGNNPPLGYQSFMEAQAQQNYSAYAYSDQAQASGYSSAFGDRASLKSTGSHFAVASSQDSYGIMSQQHGDRRAIEEMQSEYRPHQFSVSTTAGIGGKPLGGLPAGYEPLSSQSSVSSARIPTGRNPSEGKPIGEIPSGYRLYSSQSSVSTAGSSRGKPREKVSSGHKTHGDYPPRSFHGRSSHHGRQAFDPATLMAKHHKSHGVFANLESDLLSKEGMFDQNSRSATEEDPVPHPRLKERRHHNKPPLSKFRRRGSIDTPNSSSPASWKSNTVNGEASLQRGRDEMSTKSAPSYSQYPQHPTNSESSSRFVRMIPPNVLEPARQIKEAASSNRSIDMTVNSGPTTATGTRAAPLSATAMTIGDKGRTYSSNVIANMDAVVPHRTGGSFNGSRSKDTLDSRSFQQCIQGGGGGSVRGGSSLREPSREVIASMEADIMRLEEEEDRMAMDQHGGRRHPIGLAHLPQQPSGMNQRDTLSIMMMQQQQQQHQQREILHQANGNRYGHSLADQISNMAIDPLHLEAQLGADNDDSSSRSNNSFISYDGKCTNIYATRANTSEQELALHALNDAICDLYNGKAVKSILRQYPTVTRLVRADDETGNVQLHYAVRNGNVKAIRRIIRADPGCALIRNIQGYCPLHFAVQIGNYAAAQLLCCMVPASAEVQCEEGCLPLHEAVSSAAHLPDAPQITAALITAFPSAIKITNDEGLLPLHLAAMSGSSASIRTIFAFGFRTIYARENTEEMLPLDFAIEGYRTSIEEANEARGIIEAEASNDDVSEMPENAIGFRECIDIFLMSALYDRPVLTPARNVQRGIFLPIHGAAAAQPCITSWNQIVSMYGREYANDVDVRGRTALHVLVTSTLSHSDIVTQMIVDINELDPTSTTTFDDSGLIPLHAALAHRAPYHIVDNLLRTNLSTISTEVDEDCDNVEFRGMLPFQLAAACGCSLDIVNMLLRAYPTGVAGALFGGECRR